MDAEAPVPMTEQQKVVIKENLVEAMQLLLLVSQLKLDTLTFVHTLSTQLRDGTTDTDKLSQDLIELLTKFNSSSPARYTGLMRRLWLMSGGVMVYDTDSRFMNEQARKYRTKTGTMERIDAR